MSEARERADSRIIMIDACNRAAIGRFAGSIVFDDIDPGVSLRFTPGYMLSAAPRAELRAGRPRSQY